MLTMVKWSVLTRAMDEDSAGGSVSASHFRDKRPPALKRTRDGSYVLNGRPNRETMEVVQTGPGRDKNNGGRLHVFVRLRAI